ncbi:efflux RND transporter periplasmic adaptor subunit [Chitinophaga sp. NPDC101104]|uniref:efflux RND transporter periplasmic adaptor subunit n=1 Tax=Chitinophaga sp. NPDC101104 TaxID=3390561 RepID=UPI003D0176D4
MHQITGGIAIALVAASLTGCVTKGDSGNQENDLQSFPVLKLEKTDTVLHRHYVADIQAVRNVDVRARINGFLNKIYVDEGQQVKKGQLLFSLNDEERRAELARAKAALSSAIAEAKAASLEVDRVNILVTKKVISATELEVAQAKLAAFNAKVEEARSAEFNAATQLSYTSIRAPFDGFIDRIPLKTGSFVSEGNLLTTVSDIHEVYAYFNVSETEYLEFIRSGSDARRRVSLVLADGSDYHHDGHVETVESEFEENTGSIAFRARFPNPQQVLKHGASGKVTLTNRIDSCLLLPQKAVFEMQDKNYVYVLDTDNTVKMRAFEPGARISHSYLVKGGLKPGEKIVFEGVRNLREGMKISPKLMATGQVKAL